MPALSISKTFSDLADPRVERTRLHCLHDILVIALCAVLCGAEGCADTFRRVFGRLAPSVRSGVSALDTSGTRGESNSDSARDCRRWQNASAQFRRASNLCVFHSLRQSAILSLEFWGALLIIYPFGGTHTLLRSQRYSSLLWE